MYFPYLYGKQYELLALRDFSSTHCFDGTVTPIIEPVRHNPRDLFAALDALIKGGFSPLVIVNPSKSNFKAGDKGWYNKLMGNSLANANWIPTFLVENTHSSQEILNFINYFSNRNIAIAYNTSNISVADLQLIDSQANVVFQVMLPNSLNVQQRSAVSSGKAIDIIDCFRSQPRNADYGGPEFFSNQINSYQHNSYGYGDFTVLPNEVRDEGGPASAVAIHGTYKEPNSGNIYIEHYVSTVTQQHLSDVASKFLDAAGQLVTAANSRPAEFGNNVALDSYRYQVAHTHFPNLAGSKRQQMLHHICLNRQMLLGHI